MRFMFAVLTMFTLVSSGRSAAQSFEVASVKPTPKDASIRTPFRADPARVQYAGLSLKILIQIAYKLPEWGIAGGPKWTFTDRYDVVATLPPGSTPEQTPRMLQTLLTERFHLALRQETKQMHVYDLVVAKGGSKLKPGETGEQWKDGIMKGGIFKGKITMHQVNSGGLAELLGQQTGRPVMDKTHLAGIFDVNLSWTPEDTPPSDPAANGPSLFTAVEEQLGLKLTPATAPIGILVVTIAERPSEN
jgi:uncharacterized protein (TIGR03435 family)